MATNLKIALPVIALTGVFFLVIGTILTRSTIVNAQKYIHTEAILLRLSPTDTPHLWEPVVEFEMDGKLRQGYCQYVDERSFNAKAGDRIPIVYQEKRHLGVKTVEILVDDGGHTQRRSIALSMIMGAFFLLGGMVLMAVTWRLHSVWMHA